MRVPVSRPARRLHYRVGFPARHPYSGPMSFRNLHPDLKLGLVLVAAAALLTFADSSRLVLEPVAHRLGLSLSSTSLLVTAGSVGGLAVVAAAFWVDRRLPHTMMAAGAVVAPIGLSLAALAISPAFFALGIFISSVGGAAVASQIFYSVAVKGAIRYRGTLIGTLVMVFTMGLPMRYVADWTAAPPITGLAISAAAAITGAAVLLCLLPRVFASSYEPGPTLRPTLAQPSVRRAAAWLTATFFTASAATATVRIFVQYLALGASDLDYRGFPFSALPMFSGLGALLWGLAADFYPGRRLLLLVGLLLLPASGLYWALNLQPESSVAVAVFGLIIGGLICLPWVLMAELLPMRHFAKIALGIMLVGTLLGRVIGPLLGGFSFDKGALEGLLAIFVFEGIAVAVVAILLPKPQASEPQGGQ